jgi:decaprenyl-phosphate phosphoribosyltransferase
MTAEREGRGPATGARAALRLMRPHQWLKNVFVAAPLFFTPERLTAATAGRVAVGLIAFCAVSSAVYIFNDLLDREADRAHPVKRLRPLAAGTVTLPVALAMMAALLAAGLLLSLWLASAFAAVVGLYLLINIGYSLGLKRQSIVDVMAIALGFVLRVYAGGTLVGVRPTVWIIACTMLLALFLALAKRRDDLVKGIGDEHRQSLAGYSLRFVDTSIAVVLSALLVSYLLYTTAPENIRHYHTDQLYWTAPFVMAGILRYLQITLVEERSGSPTLVALTDRFLLIAMAGWVALFAWLIYG